MARNGSGTYTLASGNPVVTGTIMSSTWANNTLNDIASALTQSLASDGQTPATSDFDFGGFKIQNVGNGVASGDVVNIGQLGDTSNTALGVSLVGGASRVVDSITALKAVLKTSNNRVFVTGYYAAGDGGGGPYWYDSTDTTTADNGGTVIVAADGGRWKLIQQTGLISVRQFGAKGDGTTNDTAAVNAAIAAANINTRSTTIYFPDGRYNIPAGLAAITNSNYETWGIGSSSGGACIIASSGNLFNWGNGSSGLIVGGGLKSLKISYPANPAAGATVFRFEYCSRLFFDDLLLENIGTLAYCGETAARYASALTFSHIRGYSYNGGSQAIFRLRYGAGLFVSNASMYVGGVAAPTNPASMTTAANMYVFDGTVSNWDTVLVSNSIFERYGYGIVIAAGASMVYQNFYFDNCIFDYLRYDVVNLTTSSSSGVCASVKLNNCWMVSWEGVAISINAASGFNDNHEFHGSVPIAGNEAVFYTNPSAKSNKFHLDIGAVNRLAGGKSAFNFVAGSTGFIVSNCVGNDDNTGIGFAWRGLYGIAIGADCDRYLVDSNRLTGSSGNYSFALNTVGSTNRRISNNVGPDYAGTSLGLALPATGVAFTNKNAYAIDANVYGGTVTGIAKNGVGIPNMIAGTLRVDPGQTITVTYSSAPSFTTIGIP